MLSDLIEKEREDKKVVGRDMYGAVSHIDPVEFEGMEIWMTIISINFTGIQLEKVLFSG